MATIEHRITTCDHHGADAHPRDEAIETVDFGIDGTDYLIDLCGPSAGNLRDELRRHADAGRRKPRNLVATEAKAKRGEAAAEIKQRRERLNEVREWARTNGFSVSDRGRVRDEIIAAFDKAHAPAAPAAAPAEQSDPAQHPAPHHHEHHEHHATAHHSDGGQHDSGVRVPEFSGAAF